MGGVLPTMPAPLIHRECQVSQADQSALSAFGSGRVSVCRARSLNSRFDIHIVKYLLLTQAN